MTCPQAQDQVEHAAVTRLYLFFRASMESYLGQRCSLQQHCTHSPWFVRFLLVRFFTCAHFRKVILLFDNAHRWKNTPGLSQQLLYIDFTLRFLAHVHFLETKKKKHKPRTRCNPNVALSCSRPQKCNVIDPKRTVSRKSFWYDCKSMIFPSLT